MNTNVVFSFVSLFYSILVIILFFVRNREKTIENKLLSVLFLVNFFELLVEITIPYFNYRYHLDGTFFLTFFHKVIIFNYLLWVFTYFLYIYVVSHKTIPKNRMIVFGVFYLLANCLMLVLPIYSFVKNGYVAYTYGPSVNVMYVSIYMISFLMIFNVIKNYKNLEKTQFFPLIAFILLGLAFGLIQLKYPELLMFCMVQTIVEILMINSLENPNTKIIKELEVAKKEADLANENKTAFLSSISHEIRNPLNVIMGFSDYIAHSNDIKKAHENSVDIKYASTSLLEIVNGILDISKIDAGKYELIKESYSAKEFFESIGNVYRNKMKEKSLDFSSNIATNLPETLYGDSISIKKIIDNLLSNACKYTSKGFVNFDVNCVVNDNLCRLFITIADSGKGIEDVDLEELFNKFQTFDLSETTSIEGTGLGLSLVKKLVDLMGGEVTVTSTVGKGTKFQVVIPQKITNETVKSPINYEKVDLSGLSILVVDDATLNIKVAKKLLEKYSATDIDTCESGFECIEKVKSGKKYDVILLDHLMPKMDGIETLHQLKQIEGFDIPVVALTANAIAGIREKYIADGFVDYLAKPIEKEEVFRVFSRVLDKDIYQKEEHDISNKKFTTYTFVDGKLKTDQ